MEEVFSCSTPLCGVKAPRCPDCGSNFVKFEGEICEECAPSSCERCGNNMYVCHVLVPTTSALIPQKRNVCAKCYKEACRNCDNNSSFLDDNGICSNCSSSWIGEYGYPERGCSECGNYARLSAEGICEECYGKLHERFNTYCGRCGSVFSPSSAVNYICEDCKPICKGCRQPFNPVDKTDHLCYVCWSKANKTAQCSSCGEIDRLNDNALCEGCENRRISLATCEECAEEKILHGRICSECEDDNSICGRCLINRKPLKEYICENCKEVQEKNFR